MAATILGLDIGGANLKAATADKRAVSVPFALWKQPDRLPAALAELLARFPGVGELAVTMTGELCDCFETKRQGVGAILKAVREASGGRPFRIWSTAGAFVDPEEAAKNHLKVAAANWHALATFAGRLAPRGRAKLIDVGSTTTDLIPLCDGVPCPRGLTDSGRLASQELVYTGVKRTPVCAVVRNLPTPGHALVCAELFATTLDVYLILGLIPEDADNRDTADGRPATRACAHARLARMLGGDAETITADAACAFAAHVSSVQMNHVDIANFWSGDPGGTFILAGEGEFLAKRVLDHIAYNVKRVVSLNQELGPAVSACAPAYAVAVLATERRP
jgi:probable H4MPT-linked C1 transfer pathway protein